MSDMTLGGHREKLMFVFSRLGWRTASTPVRELDCHPTLGSPSRPLLDVEIPLRMGRYLSRYAGVGQVYRKANHVSLQPRMFLKRRAHGPVGLGPPTISQRKEVLRLPSAFRVVPVGCVALNTGVRIARPDESRPSGDLRPRQLRAKLLKPLVACPVQRPYCAPVHIHCHQPRHALSPSTFAAC